MYHKPDVGVDFDEAAIARFGVVQHCLRICVQTSRLGAAEHAEVSRALDFPEHRFEVRAHFGVDGRRPVYLPDPRPIAAEAIASSKPLADSGAGDTGKIPSRENPEAALASVWSGSELQHRGAGALGKTRPTASAKCLSPVVAVIAARKQRRPERNDAPPSAISRLPAAAGGVGVLSRCGEAHVDVRPCAGVEAQPAWQTSLHRLGQCEDTTALRAPDVHGVATAWLSTKPRGRAHCVASVHESRRSAV
mmetsp:Transcript_66474/g.185281  ORF Transcript_66474/g.185281 Transcript_66474/m.185281 type:complete len:249 (-) Transcript_66474:260-1006(-)